MNTRTGFPLKRIGGLSALAGALTLGVALLTSQGALAGGNPDFEGILSAAQPTGFMSSPDAYDISGGPVTVDFNVVVTNKTNTLQTVALNFSAHHILTYNGVDVSDGQPGQPGITFSGPAGTTQALMPGTQAFTQTWEANATSDAVAHVHLRHLRLLPARRLGSVQPGRRQRARSRDARVRLHPRARLPG